MYPPLALNGLKTRPGLPGTGFATGNCVAPADFCDEGEGFAGDLFAATRDGAFADVCFDLRETTRGLAVGTATGWPGFVTSDVVAAGVDSGPLRTCRTGAVRTRPIPQPTKLLAISAIEIAGMAQLLDFIALLYDDFSSTQHVTDKAVDSRISCRP
jgi:hypothetical protein